jgi:neurotransmitter:Na+ symporter, NSS family
MTPDARPAGWKVWDSFNLTAIGQPRGAFSSNLGFLFTAIGASIGLKSIWRFPYLAYTHGGIAFLIPYFIALLTAGFPLLLLEYGLGHSEQSSAARAYARINRASEWLGWWMTLLVMFGIMFYYQVVIAWCADYINYSLDLRWGLDAKRFFLTQYLGLTSSPASLGGLRWPIVAGTAVLWLVTWFINTRGIQHGLERACKIFMPLLFFTTLVLVIWGLTLPGAGRSIAQYLAPDWSKLWDADTWLAAYSQIFFSLSIGFGVMIAYASYLPRRTDLVQNAVVTSAANILYGLLAGLAVFTVLGFLAGTKGLPLEQVAKSGPALAFMVLPEAISRLPFLREVFGALFFLSLLLAGVASGIAIVEAFVSAYMDKFPVSRRRIVTWVCVLGFLGSLIFTTGAGLYWLDILDHFLNHYGLVVVCLMECIVIGHFLKADVLRRHVNENARHKINAGWDILIRYLTPGVLLVILIQAVAEEVARAYGGYSIRSVVLIGLGWLLATLVTAFWLAHRRWDPRSLERDHAPGGDELFK